MCSFSFLFLERRPLYFFLLEEYTTDKLLGLSFLRARERIREKICIMRIGTKSPSNKELACRHSECNRFPPPSFLRDSFSSLSSLNKVKRRSTHHQSENVPTNDNERILWKVLVFTTAFLVLMAQAYIQDNIFLVLSAVR